MHLPTTRFQCWRESKKKRSTISNSVLKGHEKRTRRILIRIFFGWTRGTRNQYSSSRNITKKQPSSHSTATKTTVKKRQQQNRYKHYTPTRVHVHLAPIIWRETANWTGILNKVPMHMHSANPFDNISDHLSGMFAHSMNNWFSAFLISCTQRNVNGSKYVEKKKAAQNEATTIVGVL